MTDIRHLALECASFTVIGSMQEEIWGNPKIVEYNADVDQWSQGLNKEGGAGCVFCIHLLEIASNDSRNILKEMKKERDSKANVPESLSQQARIAGPSNPVIKQRPGVATPPAPAHGMLKENSSVKDHHASFSYYRQPSRPD